MASYPQVTRIADVCMKLLGIRGAHGGGVCLDDIFPSLAVVDPADPSLCFLRDEVRFSGRVRIAAGGAGTYAHLTLGNPATSTALVTLSEFSVYKAAPAVIHLWTHLTVPAGVITDFSPSDGRSWATGARNPQLRNAQGVPAAVPSQGWQFPSGGPARISLVLPPGTALSVYSSTPNEQTDFNFQWTERPFDEAELR